MSVAILTVSSLSFVCSAGCLLIMLKTAKELRLAKIQVETEIDAVKSKVNRNASVVKSAFNAMEL